MYDESFQVDILPLLFEAFDTYLSSVYSGKLYYQVAPVNQYPKCIYQSQDRGGKNTDMIGYNGWRGFITFRSIDKDMHNAHALLKTLVAALPNVTLASGYSISIKTDRPLDFPVETTSGNESVYTAAIIAKIDIHKN
jgi:hypothetical protein